MVLDLRLGHGFARREINQTLKVFIIFIGTFLKGFGIEGVM